MANYHNNHHNHHHGNHNKDNQVINTFVLGTKELEEKTANEG